MNLSPFGVLVRLAAVAIHLLEEQRGGIVRRTGFGRWQNAVLGSSRADAPLSPAVAIWGDGVAVGLLLAGLYAAGPSSPVALAVATGFVAVDAAAHLLGTVYALWTERLPRWYRALVAYRRATLRSPGVVTSIACYLPIVAADWHSLVEHPVGWLGGVPILASWIGLFIVARKGRRSP